MKTSKNPYLRKIGLNLANLFFIKVSKNDIDLLELVFRENEREALGRRILILIYLLEGYTQESIVECTKCGFNTINSIVSSLNNYSGDKKLLLQNLRELYHSQFKDKRSNQTYAFGSRTIKGASKIFGGTETINYKNTKVPLLGNTRL